MPIFKHPKTGIFYIDFTLPGGERVKRSTGTKDKVAAQELHDQLRAEMWRVTKLGERRKYSFEEAAVEFLQANIGKRDYRSKVQHIRYWRDKFGGMSICSLTSETIRNAVPTHRRSRYGKAEPLTGATKNRYLATLSKLLNDCVKRGWLSVAPYIEKHGEAPVRESFMTREQAAALLQALPEGWMRDVCTFALATGMRAGEILSLEWAQVDVQRNLVSVLASKAKSGSSRPVPLNQDAMTVIKRRQGLHQQYVFARVAIKAAEVDREQFNRAAKAAGLPDGFRFHDLRHTWASWHAQAGTPLLTLQRLGGWKTLAMLNRYAHLSADDLMAYSGHVLISAHSDSLDSDRPALRVVSG